MNDAGTAYQAWLASGTTCPSGLRLAITSASAGEIPVFIKAASGQTGDLTQWRDSNNVILSRISANGVLYLTNASGVGGALLGGSGVPTNAIGGNGDYYLRTDGGATTHIYFKSAGAWAGII